MFSISIVRNALRTAAVSVLMGSTGLALPEFQTLHVFTKTCPSGNKGRLLWSPSGTLYRTSRSGGSHGKGTIYTINSAGEVGIVWKPIRISMVSLIGNVRSDVVASV